MPKQTFYNLSEEKKNKIVTAAYDEFTSKSYDDVGVRDICARAGINVASFYQYFEDKAEFFVYLLLAIDEKIESHYNRFEDRNIFKAASGDYDGIITEEEYQFAQRWFDCPVEILQKFFFGGYNDEFTEFYKEKLEQLQDKGEIRKDVDAEFASHLYTTCMFNVFMYYRKHRITSLEKRMNIKRQFFELILFDGLKPPAKNVNVTKK